MEMKESRFEAREGEVGAALVVSEAAADEVAPAVVMLGLQVALETQWPCRWSGGLLMRARSPA